MNPLPFAVRRVSPIPRIAPVPATQSNIAANPNAPGHRSFTLYFNPILAPYDLTRGGSYYTFNGHTDVKELALYVRDVITKGNWSLNLGLRGDLYNGLTIARQAEPRVGVAYNIKKTNTILRVSYARTLESPFNENLILSSIGCENAVLSPLLLCTGLSSGALSPGFRNEFHAGIEQAFGKYLVFSGEWITKYTHNGYDFSVLGNTPITFPIEWHNSKIPGYAGRVSVPDIHGFSALMVFSSVAARFFQPQIGGAGATVATSAGLPFRIDHDEKFNQTTHFQYQPWKRGPWVGFNWRYDSGLVAGNAPCFGENVGNDCPQSTVARRTTIRPVAGCFRKPPERRSGISGRVHLQWRARNPDCSAAFHVPGITVRIQPHQGAGDRSGERRSQPAAHRIPESVRLVGRP